MYFILIQAGAILHHDLSSADVILAVKEVPIKDLLASKFYFYFSHTHKGQPRNMPMLKAILEKNITLIDYELLAKENKRLVFFSKFAGYAGMIDGLHGFGQRLLKAGYATPFLNVGMMNLYDSIESAKSNLQNVGEKIKKFGLPRELGPLIFTITGTGNVSTVFDINPGCTIHV